MPQCLPIAILQISPKRSAWLAWGHRTTTSTSSLIVTGSTYCLVKSSNQVSQHSALALSNSDCVAKVGPPKPTVLVYCLHLVNLNMPVGTLRWTEQKKLPPYCRGTLPLLLVMPFPSQPINQPTSLPTPCRMPNSKCEPIVKACRGHFLPSTTLRQVLCLSTGQLRGKLFCERPRSRLSTFTR